MGDFVKILFDFSRSDSIGAGGVRFAQKSIKSIQNPTK